MYGLSLIFLKIKLSEKTMDKNHIIDKIMELVNETSDINREYAEQIYNNLFKIGIILGRENNQEIDFRNIFDTVTNFNQYD